MAGAPGLVLSGGAVHPTGQVIQVCMLGQAFLEDSLSIGKLYIGLVLRATVSDSEQNLVSAVESFEQIV